MTDRKLFHGFMPVAALSALAVAGCGGGGNSDASFISKVNAECRSTQSQVDALGQPASASTADVTAWLKKILPLEQASLDKLKAISAPSDKKADYQAALDNQDQALAVAQQAITAGGAGNSSQFSQLVGQLSGLSTGADALATKIGVTDCLSKNSAGGGGAGTTTT